MRASAYSRSGEALAREAKGCHRRGVGCVVPAPVASLAEGNFSSLAKPRAGLPPVSVTGLLAFDHHPGLLHSVCQGVGSTNAPRVPGGGWWRGRAEVRAATWQEWAGEVRSGGDGMRWVSVGAEGSGGVAWPIRFSD